MHYVPICFCTLRAYVPLYFTYACTCISLHSTCLCSWRAFANLYAYLATIFWVCHGFTCLCTFMFYKPSFLFAICFYVPRLIQVVILLWVWHKLKSWTWLEKLAEFYSIKITKNFLIQQLVGNKAKGRVSKER